MRQAHQYIRGKPAKFLILFRPATGELRGKPVDQSTNAILHPWLKQELEEILKQCPSAPSPEAVREGCRWQNWDIYPSAEQLDRFFPPIRVLVILDNLMGHRSHDLVHWCFEQGICLLYTPNAGSWLNMAESVQRIIVRRALEGHHVYNVEVLKEWITERPRHNIGTRGVQDLLQTDPLTSALLSVVCCKGCCTRTSPTSWRGLITDAIAGWNRQPTPFIWGGKRHARRDRAYARRHRLGGSGATTHYVVPRRIRSVRFYRRVENYDGLGK